MAVATYTDVGVALRRTISDADEQAQITWWLDGIELLIANRLGAVDDLDPALVKFVEVEAAVAKINRAGRSESSVTVSVDDGSVTRRYEHSVSSGDITDEWWNLLDPDAGRSSSSIRPGFDADETFWAISTPGLASRSPEEFGWFVP